MEPNHGEETGQVIQESLAEGSPLDEERGDETGPSDSSGGVDGPEGQTFAFRGLSEGEEAFLKDPLLQRITEQAQMEEGKERRRIAKLSTPASELAIPELNSPAFTEFMREWDQSEEVKKGGRSVLGKKVRMSVAKKLKEMAVEASVEQFSIFELAKMLKNHEGLTLQGSLEFLERIRDNPDNNPRDRMLADDKIRQIVLAIVKSNIARNQRETIPDTENRRKDSNLMAVLVNVRAPLSEESGQTVLDAKQIPAIGVDNG